MMVVARVLRYLATRHVFKEVAPNVFANNRLSSALIKKHTLEEIKAKLVHVHSFIEIKSQTIYLSPMNEY